MKHGTLQATLVAIVLFPSSIYLGGIVAYWISAGLVVLIGRGSLSAVTAIPRKGWVFPVSAPWFTETEKTLWNIGGILAILAAVLVMIWCIKLWRHIVVNKFNWMTDEEVDEFLIRGGDKPVD